MDWDVIRQVGLIAAGAMVVLPDRPWWLVGVYAVAVMLAIFVSYFVRGRRDLAPVAHRLSAEEQVA